MAHLIVKVADPWSKGNRMFDLFSLKCDDTFVILKNTERQSY